MRGFINTFLVTPLSIVWLWLLSFLSSCSEMALHQGMVMLLAHSSHDNCHSLGVCLSLVNLCFWGFSAWLFSTTAGNLRDPVLWHLRLWRFSPIHLFYFALSYCCGWKVTFPLCVCLPGVEEELTKVLAEFSWVCKHPYSQPMIRGAWCTPESTETIAKGYTILIIFVVNYLTRKERKRISG